MGGSGPTGGPPDPIKSPHPIIWGPQTSHAQDQAACGRALGAAVEAGEGRAVGEHPVGSLGGRNGVRVQPPHPFCHPIVPCNPVTHPTALYVAL